MKKRVLTLVLAVALALCLTACGAGSAGASSATSAGGEKTYTVGICQLIQHAALDAATQGFQDALTEKLGNAVTFDLQNASGDSATCATICSGFVSSGVDLILANATPALQAAVAATDSIPILGTSVTDYATALNRSDWDGTSGINLSGTSDLAPLNQQAEMLHELFPEAKSIGLLYCSGEPNSVYQADAITGFLEADGYTVSRYTFADSNDVSAVAATACGASDVLYIPTDNTAAACTEAINNVALNAKVPIVAGEEGICQGCGVATLSIDYYELGRATGEMAYEILVNGADPAAMPIQTAPSSVKEYDADRCAALGVTVPEGYTAIGA